MLFGFDPTTGVRARRAGSTASPVLTRAYAAAASAALIENDKAERARAHDQRIQLLLLAVLVGACVGAAILGARSVLSHHNSTAPAPVRVVALEQSGGNSMASFLFVTFTLSTLLGSGVCVFYSPPPAPPRPSKSRHSSSSDKNKDNTRNGECCDPTHKGPCQCTWEARPGTTVVIRRTTASADTPPPPLPQRPVAPHATPANVFSGARHGGAGAAPGALGVLRTTSLPEIVTTPISASPSAEAGVVAGSAERRSVFPSPAPPRTRPAVLGNRRDPLRVLLVDDSPINIQVASKFLRILKIDMDTVDVAADGLQAVVCAERLLHVKSPRMPEAPAPGTASPGVGDDAAGVGAAPPTLAGTANVASPTADSGTDATTAESPGFFTPAVPTHPLLLPHLPRPRSLLVLMDLMMPVMDGYEAAARIRALGRMASIPVYILALTADGLESTRERCLSTDFDEVLVKPFVVGDLRGTLARARAALGIEP